MILKSFANLFSMTNHKKNETYVKYHRHHQYMDGYRFNYVDTSSEKDLETRQSSLFCVFGDYFDKLAIYLNCASSYWMRIFHCCVSSLRISIFMKRVFRNIPFYITFYCYKTYDGYQNVGFKQFLVMQYLICSCFFQQFSLEFKNVLISKAVNE